MTDVHDAYPGDDEPRAPQFLPDELEDAWLEEIEEPEKVWGDEELTEMAQSLFSNLSYWMTPSRLRTRMQDMQVSVVSGDYEEKAYGKPARVVTPQANAIQVLFDVPTYEDLADQFAGIDDVTERAVAELYLGTGIALHLLTSRIKNMKSTSVEQLMNILGPSGGSQISPIDDLSEAVRRADVDFSREEIADLVQSTVFMNDERRIYANSLRLAAGLLFGKQGDLSSTIPHDLVRPESNFTRSCRSELKDRLTKSHTYTKFYEKLLGMDDGEAERFFAESIPELELAVAFPMNSAELRTVLQICRS